MPTGASRDPIVFPSTRGSQAPVGRDGQCVGLVEGQLDTWALTSGTAVGQGPQLCLPSFLLPLAHFLKPQYLHHRRQGGKKCVLLLARGCEPEQLHPTAGQSCCPQSHQTSALGLNSG